MNTTKSTAKSTDVTLSLNGIHGIVSIVDLTMLIQFGISIDGTSSDKFYKLYVYRACDNDTVIKLLNALSRGYVNYLQVLATI
jgi:hypothetical protein